MIDEDAPFEEIERLERELAKKNEILAALKEHVCIVDWEGGGIIDMHLSKAEHNERDYETIKKWLEEEAQ